MTEREILERIFKISRRTGFAGNGDDAAVFAPGWVASTDQFIEFTHFTWEQMTPEQIGFKAVTQALSDLAAMAAEPRGVLASLAWPAVALEKILQVYEGIESACVHYKVPLLGGDISRAVHTYMDFTVLGQSSRPLLQSGASPGDLIAVTGAIGSAQGGWFCQQHHIEAPTLLKAFQKPEAQIATALSLAKHKVITALTDISDSLSHSLHHISRRSGVGMEIELEKIPQQTELQKVCAQQRWRLKDFLLGGGEDYQLLATLSPKTSKELILDHGLTVIGQVIEGENCYSEGGKKFSLPEVGWDPFVL